MGWNKIVLHHPNGTFEVSKIIFETVTLMIQLKMGESIRLRVWGFHITNKFNVEADLGRSFR